MELIVFAIITSITCVLCFFIFSKWSPRIWYFGVDKHGAIRPFLPLILFCCMISASFAGLMSYERRTTFNVKKECEPRHYKNGDMILMSSCHHGRIGSPFYRSYMGGGLRGGK